MSVRTMARVWEHSKHGGTHLLMLLAIADFADDDGNAYPAVSTLAEKCRMGQRNANLILAALRKSGELVIRQNEGPKGTNRYFIPLKPTSPLKDSSPLKRTSSTPEAGFLKPLKPTSDEPSVNHQEPSTRARASISSASSLIGFAEFWSAYPRKVSKAAAEKAWAKLNPGPLLLPELLAALERQKAGDDWTKDGGRFIPHPATWINGRRWEDEPAGSAAGADERAAIFAGAL